MNNHCSLDGPGEKKHLRLESKNSCRVPESGADDEIDCAIMYRVLGIYDVKGYDCYVLKFGLPPFPPPLPSGFNFQNKPLTS